VTVTKILPCSKKIKYIVVIVVVVYCGDFMFSFFLRFEVSSEWIILTFDGTFQIALHFSPLVVKTYKL
jgi:hypothetical protein